MIERAFNYSHYIAQRKYAKAIKKCDMYSLLDNRKKIMLQSFVKYCLERFNYTSGIISMNKAFGIETKPEDFL